MDGRPRSLTLPFRNESLKIEMELGGCPQWHRNCYLNPVFFIWFYLKGRVTKETEIGLHFLKVFILWKSNGENSSICWFSPQCLR